MELTCPHCRHVVGATPGAPTIKCSNCGARLPRPGAEPAPGTGPAPTVGPPEVLPQPPPSRADGLAIASLIFGLLFCVPVVAQVLAIAFGLGALLRRRPEGRRHTSLAWVGLVLGVIVLFAWVYFVRAAWMGAVSSTGTGYVGLGYSPYGTTNTDDAAFDEIQTMTSVLGVLDNAIKAYRRDFGAWPANLDVLSPVYLSAELAAAAQEKALSGHENRITLRTDVDPLHDPPDRVVAHSAPVHVNSAGEKLAKPHRWVLRLNGETSFVPSDEVEAALDSPASPSRSTARPGAPTS